MSAIDTSSPEHLMACLARQVLADCGQSGDPKANTRALGIWLDRWGQRHGPAARAELREAVVAEMARASDALDLTPDEVPADTVDEHEARKAALLANRESYARLAADDITGEAP